MEEEEKLNIVALTMIPGIGGSMARKLLAYCGSAMAVFREKKYKLEKIREIGKMRAEWITSGTPLKKAEKELRFIEKEGIKLLFYKNPDYPSRLKQCPDSPILLYFKGKGKPEGERVISIVGTRKATEYGLTNCKKLVEEMRDHGILVVSGLAYGIDVSAHEAAMSVGLPTVGVVAHGLDQIYPTLHQKTAKKMMAEGGLLTEYPSGTKLARENFPARNRIVAGLADALLVIESGVSGGSLITAEIALSYNRDIFALPGNAGVESSAGCNGLIKRNKAALVESAVDIFYQMGWDFESEKRKSKKQKSLFPEFPEPEASIMKILIEKGKTDIDYLTEKSGLVHGKLAAILLSLEMDGHIKVLPGKMYQAET